MTAVMTFTGTTQVAYSEGDDGVAFWNKVVAYSDSFSWSDVFDANDGLDLYVLIYKKTTEYPEKDALRDLALNYGMTTDEAKAALDGSITPIFNSPDRNGLVLSQADALAIVKEMQTDYNSLKELYDIEQEVDMAIKPSELFANGDLSDSGFDLISDLDRIEQILFFNETATTVGGDFAGALDSPNNVVERDEVFADYVASETPVAVDRLSLKPGDEPSAVVQLGGAELPVEILDQDICVLDDPTKEALDQYEQEQAEADVLARAEIGRAHG